MASMQASQTWVLNLLPVVILASALILKANAIAQILPDTTLGTEHSIVNSDVDIKGVLSDVIEGGIIRGNNLFHSFQEFNVSEARGAYFANSTDISLILSRVTGTQPSSILGTLGVLGGADLFFLNPNGILFGPNASLDVSSSFMASTADSVVFADGFRFSSSDPPPPHY